MTAPIWPSRQVDDGPRGAADSSTANEPTRAPRPAPNTWWLVAGLALAFLITHGVLIYQSLGPATLGANDVRLYAAWVEQGQSGRGWLGIDATWVYPVGALVPMLLASVFGLDQNTYLSVWCVMVAAINLATSAVVVRRFGVVRATGPLAVWFVFLMLLGPCGMTRLDAVMMPLVLIGLAVASVRPALASVLATSAAWIKVSGGLILVPLFAVMKTWRSRLVSVVAPAAATCLVVVLLQQAAGGQWRFLTSFVSAETGRGLQIEAVLATPVVLALASRGQTIYRWNNELSTYETWGAGADLAIRVSDVGMPLMVLAVGVLVWLARRRPTAALLVGSLAMMSGLIVTHKVGSPQFLAWIAPAMVVGLAVGRRAVFWIPVAGAGLIAAALTGLLYPGGYGAFLSADRTMLAIWVIRNLLVVAIFASALLELVRLRRSSRSRPGQSGSTADHDQRPTGSDLTAEDAGAKPEARA
jgi:hypothetical protein